MLPGRHDGVTDVAVVGMPDERLDEAAAAFVILKEGANLQESDLLDYCKGKLASFKLPKHIFIVKEFPLTGSGKIQKFKLREEIMKNRGNN